MCVGGGGGVWWCCSGSNFVVCFVLYFVAFVHSQDMGFAKPIPFKRGHIVSQRSFSLCGTPDYVSPELVLGKGHDHTVDYWAYGVYVYELMVGRTPFFHDDQNQVFKMICNASEVRIPLWGGLDKGNG